MISVFTPSHNTKYLKAAYQSLIEQTFQNWEWVLLLNNGLEQRRLPREIATDSRVRVYQAGKVLGVGEAKRLACELAKGEILVELDHDDKLRSDCLERIKIEFDFHPDAVFAYSNTVQINEDGSPNLEEWSGEYGWKYETMFYEGQEYKQAISFGAYPHNVSFIWYAPNHVRAFKREAYFAAGGYDAAHKVLDDQDLMSRLYLQGEFIHIDEGLYFQRIYPQQTQKDPELNRYIQTHTVELHGQYITKMAGAWAKRNGLLALDMGGAHRKQEGYLAVDIDDMPGVDVVADAMKRLPFEDNSVGVIRAVDFMEHIPNKVHLIKEFYRVLAHGGMLLSMTPSSDGRGAFQDPTHVAYYNENSFWYYTKKQYQDFIHGLEVRFQESRVWTGFPSQWHQDNNIPYVHAHLIAIKDNRRDFGGLLHI